MISMNPPIPPIPPEESSNSFERLMALIALVNNPEAAAKYVGEIFAARMDWVEAKSNAEQVLKELGTKRAEHDALIAKERADHAASLAADRAKLNHECSHAMGEVNAKAAETNRLHDRARADAQAVAELKTDLEARLAKIREASR